ncbi:MAG: class I SAM-dependent RNA methyltransferase [Chthoniobacterales bacterium]|nr:class I SAM-dependent RNA methyltransferase [Chthoniobacterales bacterium]
MHHDGFVKPGDEIDLEVTDLAYGGAGIARHEQQVVFVRFTIPGETVRARIRNVRRTWAEADALRIIHPSPDRVAPPCPFFTRCGGCAYQHITYPRQLTEKTRQVRESLRRIGKFADAPVEQMRSSPHEYGYRNRITVHVDPPRIGFRGTDPRRIVDVDRCLLANKAVNDRLEALHSKRRLRPGPATLRDTASAAGGFRQVNDEAAEILAEIAADMAGSGQILIDAYCGAGFFAQRLSKNFARVIGMDWDGRSIATARIEAGAKEEYVEGDTAELLPAVLQANEGAVLLLDPPAQGLAAEVIAAILAFRPPRIVYISCDPSTLARDLAKVSGSYELRRAVPVDMFPQTASIEVAALLEIRPGDVNPRAGGEPDRSPQQARGVGPA